VGCNAGVWGWGWGVGWEQGLGGFEGRRRKQAWGVCAGKQREDQAGAIRPDGESAWPICRAERGRTWLKVTEMWLLVWPAANARDDTSSVRVIAGGKGDGIIRGCGCETVV